MNEPEHFMDVALAELTHMAADLKESGRQYEEWCARHGYQRNSFFPGRMEQMYEADHTEALKLNQAVRR